MKKTALITLFCYRVIKSAQKKKKKKKKKIDKNYGCYSRLKKKCFFFYNLSKLKKQNHINKQNVSEIYL